MNAIQPSVAQQQENDLVLKPMSVMDLTTDQFKRLEVLARTFATSAFNSGNERLSQEDAMLIMLKGIELGLRPITAMDFINVIHGKPVVDGKGMLALIRGSGKAAYFDIDSQPTQCVVKTKRKDGGQETTVTWDMNRARQFQVYDKKTRGFKPLSDQHQWRSQPQVMLKWRAVTEAAREVYSDVIGGLYTREELSDGNGVVVHDDGRMFETLPPSKPPSLPEKTGDSKSGSGQPKREQTGDSKSESNKHAIRHGDSSAQSSPTSPKNWLEAMKPDEVRNAVTNKLVEAGVGESAAEGWQNYSQFGLPGVTLHRMSDLGEHFDSLEDALASIAAYGKRLAGQTELSDEEQIDLAIWASMTFKKELDDFGKEAIITQPSYEAAQQEVFNRAITQGAHFYAERVEYKTINGKKAMVYHLPDNALPKRGDKPLMLMTFGGRSQLKSMVGTEAYEAIGIDAWELDNTYDQDFTLKVERDGDYLKVTEVQAVLKAVTTDDVPF